MPCGLNPVTANQQCNRIVCKVQRRHCRPAGRRQPDDPKPIVRPAKVHGPPLLAWIKQRHFDARCRIDGRRAIRFVTIAKRAAEPKIGFVIRAAVGAWQDVFDVQSAKDQVLRAEAIAAAFARRRTHASNHLGGKVIMRHGRQAAASSRVLRLP